MKKLIVGMVLGIGVVLVMAAARAQLGSELCTPNFPWVSVTAWTSAGTEPTALAVGERTFKTVTAAIAAAATDAGDEEIVIYTVPYGTNAIRIRCLGTTANSGVTTFDVLSGTFNGGLDDCNFALRGTLTFTTGSQVSAQNGTFEICDIVVLTASSDAASTSDWTIANPGDAGETAAEAMLDLQGDDTVVLVPTATDQNAIPLIKPY